MHFSYLSLPRWVWRPNAVGWIAVGNMGVVLCCGLLHLALFPEGIIRIDVEPQWKLAADDVLFAIVAAFVFPLGWIVESVTGGVSTPPFLAPIYVPLNAYLWGWVGNVLFRRRHQPDSSRN